MSTSVTSIYSRRIFAIGLLALLAFMPTLTFAQKFGRAKVDSILKVLPTLKQDVKRLEAYNDLAVTYLSLSPEPVNGIVTKRFVDTLSMALTYIDKQITLAGALKNNDQLAYGYVNKAAYYARQQLHREGLTWFAKAAGLPVSKSTADYFARYTIPASVWYINHDPNLNDAAKQALLKQGAQLFADKDPRYLAVFKNGMAKSNEPTSHADLMKKVRAMKVDSLRLKYFINNVMKMDDFWRSNADSAKMVNDFTDMRALADKTGYKRAVYTIDLMLGSYYVNLYHDHVKGLDLLQRSADLAEKNKDQRTLAEALNGIGGVYNFLGYSDKSLQYRLQMIKIIRSIKNERRLAWALYNLASVYSAKDDFAMAAKYDEEALAVAGRTKNDTVKTMAAGDLSWSYYNLKKYLPAYKYHRLATDTDSLNFFGSRANRLNTLGRIYRDAPDADLIKMGITPADRDKKALECFERSQAERIYNPNETGTNLKDLSDMYAKYGQYDKAYKAYKEYVVKLNRINSRDKESAVLQRQFREDYTKKEQALTAEQQQQRNYYIIGISALALILFFIGRNYFIQRKLNKLVTIEKQRSEDLLMNILPADVAEELKQKGSANARLFDEVTVIFTDFVNFTTVSQMLTPQELVDELHFCFKAFDEIIYRHGIEKIKTIGDAYLAVSGLPNANRDHAVNAVKAAVEIQQFIKTRKAEMGDHSFDIRVGIHSGSVVAGIVGVKKFAYDIWGDTVNTAARMEQNSEPGKINVSGETYELVKEQFQFIYRGEIDAKNKGALKMYFVTA